VRRRLLRWAGWFAVANAALLGVVGLRYLWYYSALGATAAWGYALVAYVGHVSALACVPLGLALVPAIVLIPRPGLVVPLGVALGSAGASLLLLDSLVFAENRYHLDALTFSLLDASTLGFLAVYFAVALAIEAMVAAWLWRRTERQPGRRVGRWIAVALVGCFVAGQVIHAFAAAHFEASVTAFTRYLPLYYPVRNTGLLARLGLVDRYEARERGVHAALAAAPGGDLRYPLAPLRCPSAAPSLNLLLVVIDAMRADSLTPEFAPRLTEFARGAIRFDRHSSGGNSSRPGLFSLFYGIPPTYFDAFAERARPPVLVDLLRRYGYDLGLFASSPIYRLVDLDRTVFARVPNLRRETSSGIGSAGRDRVLTEEWLAWLARRDPGRPFFGFLYYNAAVALEPPPDYPAIPAAAAVPPAQRARNSRYLTAVRYIDSLLGRVLDDLERRALLDRTIVVITSDHGMEFDESGLGFKGHGTAYSDYQMRTPFIVRWPGHPPARVTRRTSHYDLAPTLVAELFGCDNPPADYASGASLFSEAEWRWLVAASYREYAVVEPDRVTIVFGSGYEVRDADYRLARVQSPPRDTLRAAMQEMGRFYR